MTESQETQTTQQNSNQGLLAAIVVLVLVVIGFAFFAYHSRGNSLTDEDRVRIVKEVVEAIRTETTKTTADIKTAIEDVKETAPDPFAPISEELRTAIETTENVPAFGPADAETVMVMFSDPNCGYCRRQLSAILRLMDEHSEVRVVFREIPVVSAETVDVVAIAHALHMQGKYREYLTELADSSKRVNGDIALEMARKIGADMDRLRNDRFSRKTTEATRENIALASKVNVTGTPTLFINGTVLRGAHTYEDIREIIEKIKEGRPSSPAENQKKE